MRIEGYKEITEEEYFKLKYELCVSSYDKKTNKITYFRKAKIITKEKLIKWFIGRFYGNDDMTTDNYDEILKKLEELKWN